MKTITTHYIDGAFIESQGREVMDIIRPTNGQVIGRVTMADEEDTLAENLAAAQQALAENTDPERQLELEAGVVRAAQAMERANDAVSAAQGYTVDYSGRIGELQEELGGLQGSLGDLGVIGNGQSPVRRRVVTQNHVTSALPVENVPDLCGRLHDVATRNDRQRRHELTSTSSSVTEGGIGSSCAWRLSM